MLDSFTNSMCIDSWGRSSFAYCLIEVKIDEVLKESITMGIPMPKGMGFSKEMVYVEYEWKPPRCDQYKIFGHVYDHCPKNAITNPTVDLTNDGFQMVVNKRKKGKTWSTNPNHSGFNGIKATWQPIKPKPSKDIKLPSSSNILTSNPYASLSQDFDPETYIRSREDVDSDEEVEVSYDESANLLKSTKTGASTSMTSDF
ncbi:hypothetical protein Tco_0634750 [Tanacetum coccineum]